MTKNTSCYKKIVFLFGVLFMFASLILSVCLLTTPDKPTLSFLPLKFTFSSGAGGWQTTLTLNPDGTFTGEYGDSEMGARDTDYPNGTQYICEFSGKFENFKKVNDYTYSMSLSSIKTKHKDGKEWIQDGVKYIAASPYGIDGGSEFSLYTPQTPAIELWDDFFVWSNLQKDEKLSRYAIRNTTTNSCFFSDPITTETASKTKDTYHSLMNDFYNNTPDFYYAYKDVNGDGTYELLIMENTTLFIYTYNGGVKQLDNYDFVTGTFRLFASENQEYPGIFVFTVGGGCDHYNYLALYDEGNIGITKLCEYYYSADEPYWNNISNDKEMIAEAKALYNENKDIKFLKFEPTSTAEDSVTFVNGATQYTATVLFDDTTSSAESIVISNTKTDKEIQTISLNRSEEVTSCDKNIYALDVNFDGYYDLLVPDRHPARAIFLNAYIYDSAQKQFVEAPIFKDLPSIALDTANKQILYHSSGDGMTYYGMASYVKDKEDFVVTNSVLIEPNYTDNTTEFSKYYFAEYDHNKKAIVKEFNIPVHEFYLYPISNPDLVPYYEGGSFWDLDSDKWDCVFKYENGKVYLPDSVSNNVLNLTADEVRTIFEPIIKKGEKIHESINNDLADIEMEDKIAFTLENDGYEYSYQLITNENLKTLDDVWQFAYSAYTREAAYRLFADRLDQSGSPRFLERDGKLYYYKGGHGYSSNFDFDSLQIITQFDNTVIISIDNYGFGTDESSPDKCIFIMQNTENGWRLANSVDESVDKINLDNYIAYLPNRKSK